MSESVIEIDGLRKSYKQRPALDGLNVRVQRGSIYGFLGRNGAGKTTTIKILMGMLRSDEGRARLFGGDVSDEAANVAARARIGFVTEDKDLYPYMNVGQIIKFTRPFFPKWRTDLEQRYLRMFDLPVNKKISDLSKGMRSKLMLLLAISHGAELLILDEPTDGLDPAAVDEVLRELVAIAGREGTTIFFSSHHLEEVEQIAESVCIVDRGKSIVEGVLDDLKHRYQRLQIVFEGELPESLRRAEGVERLHRNGRSVSILASRNADGIAREVQARTGAEVEMYPVTLRELFLEHVRSDEHALV